MNKKSPLPLLIALLLFASIADCQESEDMRMSHFIPTSTQSVGLQIVPMIPFTGWEEPKNLGELLLMDANQPRISPDGKYIFFIGNEGYSYRVDSRILERM